MSGLIDADHTLLTECYVLLKAFFGMAAYLLGFWLSLFCAISCQRGYPLFSLHCVWKKGHCSVNLVVFGARSEAASELLAPGDGGA